MKSKVRVPSQERSKHTRDKIIAAALEMFSEKGYHATNSKEIANHAGVAIGSFYSYFKDKKELFIETFKYFDTFIENRMNDNIADTSGHTDGNAWMNLRKNLSDCNDNKEKLKIVFTNLLKSHNYYPGFSREVSIMRLLDPDIKKAVDEHEIADIKNMTEIIKSIGDNLRIEDVDIAANIIYHTLELIIHETATAPGMEDRQERIINGLTDMIARYLIKDCN